MAVERMPSHIRDAPGGDRGSNSPCSSVYDRARRMVVGRRTPRAKRFGTPLIFWILFPLGPVDLYVLVARKLFSGSYLIIDSVDLSQ